MSLPETLPALLEEQAARHPDAPAIRYKRLGIWRVVSWAEYAAATREVALALDELGVGAGDRVAVIADNGPAWLEVDLAVQATGAWSIGVYPSLAEQELAPRSCRRRRGSPSAATRSRSTGCSSAARSWSPSS